MLWLNLSVERRMTVESDIFSWIIIESRVFHCDVGSIDFVSKHALVHEFFYFSLIVARSRTPSKKKERCWSQKWIIADWMAILLTYSLYECAAGVLIDTTWRRRVKGSRTNERQLKEDLCVLHPGKTRRKQSTSLRYFGNMPLPIRSDCRRMHFWQTLTSRCSLKLEKKMYAD